jgi:hypothetical protein
VDNNSVVIEAVYTQLEKGKEYRVDGITDDEANREV